MKRIKYRDQFFYKYAIMSIVRHKKCLYNTLYIRYAGIVQRFVCTIEFFMDTMMACDRLCYDILGIFHTSRDTKIIEDRYKKIK